MPNVKVYVGSSPGSACIWCHRVDEVFVQRWRRMIVLRVVRLSGKALRASTLTALVPEPDPSIDVVRDTGTKLHKRLLAQAKGRHIFKENVRGVPDNYDRIIRRWRAIHRDNSLNRDI